MEKYIVSIEYDGKPRKLFIHICERCNKQFYAPRHKVRKYCSIECASVHKNVFNLICNTCDKHYVVYRLGKSKSGLRFCSRLCRNKAQRIENFGQIIRPDATGQFGYRELAFRHFPHKCNRCGYDVHIEILQVHHRDRNRLNNDLSNLEILCPNCHELEHYFGRIV